MEKNVITHKSSYFRLNARTSLVGNWKEGMLVYFVVLLLLTLPITLLTAILPNIATIYMFIVEGAFLYTMSDYAMKLANGEDHSAKDIFAGFRSFNKAFILLLWESLWLMLWSLIFLIPMIFFGVRLVTEYQYAQLYSQYSSTVDWSYVSGADALLFIVLVIALLLLMLFMGLRYAMAFFIIRDDKPIGVRKALKDSIKIMRGNKRKLFILQLTFIGWYVLASIANLILNYILGLVLGEGIIFDAITDVFLAATIAAIVLYVYVAMAHFFKELVACNGDMATEENIKASQDDTSKETEEMLGVQDIAEAQDGEEK